MSEGRLHVGSLTAGDVALLKNISDESAQKAVAAAFEVMGLNSRDPIASQTLFTALRDVATDQRDPENSKDRQWTRRTRERSEGIIGKGLVTAMGLVVVGAMHTLWVGVKSLIAH